MARQKFYNKVEITDSSTDDIVLPLKSPNGGVFQPGTVVTRPEPMQIPIIVTTDESPENQPFEGQEIHYKHRGKIVNSDMDFLGRIIPQRYLQSNLDIVARYNGTDWDVITSVDSLSGSHNKIFTMVNEASQTTTATSGFQILKTGIIPAGTFDNKGDELELHVTGYFAPSGNPTNIRVSVDQGAASNFLYYTPGPSVSDGNFDIKIRIEKAEADSILITDAVYLNSSVTNVVHGSLYLDLAADINVVFEAEEAAVTPIGTEVTLEGFKMRKL